MDRLKIAFEPSILIFISSCKLAKVHWKRLPNTYFSDFLAKGKFNPRYLRYLILSTWNHHFSMRITIHETPRTHTYIYIKRTSRFVIGKHDESFPRNSLANYNVVTVFRARKEERKEVVARSKKKRKLR